MPEVVIKSKGKEFVCLYDQRDHKLINQHTWSLHSKGYATTNLNGKQILMHRLILGIVDRPEIEADHIFHNKLDNRRSKIRVCSHAQNRRNSRKLKESAQSQYKGVYRDQNKWHAQIQQGDRVLNLGRYRSEVTAAKIYDQVAKEIFKDFAFLNFPNINPLPKQLSLFDLITEQNTIRVNLYLIKREVAEGFIKELSLYYFIKYHFIHSRISYLNKPKERISSLSGLSVKTINKYFDTLCYRGLLKVHPWGWELNTYKSKGRYKILVAEQPTLIEIKNLLLSKILEREGQKQALYDSLRLYLTDGGRGRESLGKMKPDVIYRPRFSIRYIAKVLNISHKSTIKLVKELNLMGIIKTEPPVPEFKFSCSINILKHLEGLPGYKYYQSGAVYEIQPSTYEFLQHPIKSKEITLQRYKAIIKNPSIRKFVDEINQLFDYQITL